MAKPVSKLIHQASEFIAALENPESPDHSLIRFCEASTETWLEIVNHSEDATVWVALNKTIPIEVITVLAKHSSARVRRFAADKNSITPELIALLATDSDPSVRLRIANHKKTSPEILRTLLQDDWDQVVEIAREKLDALEQKNPQTINDYIARFPTDVQIILERIRETIGRAAPNATEKISYQMPTFALNGNLVFFAAYKNHIGFYPSGTGIAQFKNELAGFQTSKGAIRFALNEPIPYELIHKIVAFRAEENSGKAKQKKR